MKRDLASLLSNATVPSQGMPMSMDLFPAARDNGPVVGEATMQAYEPTVRDNIGHWIAGDGSNPWRQDMARRLVGSAGAGTTDDVSALGLTPIGSMMDMQDAYRSGSKGGMALAALGAVPGMNVESKIASTLADAAGKTAKAGLADRVMQNWGSKHAFEAKNAAKVEAMGDRAFSTAGRTKTEAVDPTYLRQMAVDQGDDAVLAHVRAGGHLRPDGTGGYIGMPRTIDSPQALGGLRRKLDGEITNAAEAVELGDPDRLGTWYERAKGAMAATNEPHQLERSLGAHGTYSAGVSPESELGFSLKHYNSRALGEPGMAFRSKPMQALDKADEAGIPVPLADKTDEYRNKLDPRLPVSGLFGVNDFRAAQNFGYTNKQGKPWKAQVSPTMHPVMDGETALLTDRMNAARAGDKADWSGPQMQELPWVYGKAQDLYERGKNARFKGDPLEGRMAAIREANNTFEDYLPKHTASATHEAVPSGQIDHVRSVLDMPYEAREDYGRVGRWDVETPVEGQIPGQEHIGAGRRDAIYSALGLRQLPSVPSVGAWMEEGKLQNNPLTIARPLVDFPTGGGGGAVAPLTEDALGFAERFRAGIDAQAAGAANMPNTMKGAKDKTGVLLDTVPHGGVTGAQPSAEQLAAINDAAGQYGYGASASNRGVLVYPYGDGSAKNANKMLKDPAITGVLPNATAQRARPNTVYEQTHVIDGVPQQPFSGAVTSSILNSAAQLPPTVSQNLSESDAVRRIIGQKMARDSMLEGPREDIQNMRQFFRDADWPRAVEMIRKGMAPAAALAAMGYSLDAMADEQQPR